MAKDILKNVRIRGIACSVPTPVIEIDDYIPLEGVRSIEKFKKTTGVYQKHCCSKDHVITASDLCCTAAEKLMEELKLDRSDIDAVIFVTQSADYGIPSTACVIQHRLGLDRECLAYDINLGCSGYPYGLHVAASYLQSGHLKHVLLLTGEAGVHNAPEGSLLFGEAGAATLLAADNEAEDMEFILQTMGEGFRNLISLELGQRHGAQAMFDKMKKEGLRALDRALDIEMDGAEIFNFSIREVPRLIKSYFNEFGYDTEAFDIFAFHQANLMILQQLMKRLKLPGEKFPISLDLYGNTSSASIPLAICDYFNRMNPTTKEEGQKKIMICGYGVGLSLGVTSFTIDGQHCFPIITTDQGYNDGL